MQKNGFTLIELLVVLLILSGLAGLVGPKVLKYLGGSQVKTAQVQLHDLSVALDMYAVDQGRYPNAQEGLQVLVVAPEGGAPWGGPYLKGGELPKDPWGQAYRYEVNEQGYELMSLGADREDGGEGDAADLRVKS